MLIGAPIPILVLASLVTEKPIGNLFGKNICWLYSFLASCCVTKIGIGGFFLAIYRIICLKWPLQGMKKLKQISNELIVLEWITAFFLSGIHMSGIGFTGTDLSLAFCRYLYIHSGPSSTLCCISLGRCFLGLETRVIIKISKNPC